MLVNIFKIKFMMNKHFFRLFNSKLEFERSQKIAKLNLVVLVIRIDSSDQLSRDEVTGLIYR